MSRPTFKINPGQAKIYDALRSDARYVLARSGSGSGKTFAIVRAILLRAMLAPNSTHGIFRRFGTTARATIWKQTIPDVMRACWPGLMDKCAVNETTMTLTLPSGSTVLVLGLDDGDTSDKILGLNLSTAFCDEATDVSWANVSKLLTRVRQRAVKTDGRPLDAKIIFACNPTSSKHWLHDLFVKGLIPGTSEPFADAALCRDVWLSPHDNIDNLGDGYIRTLEALSARDRRRFLLGEWTTEVDGALFHAEWFDAHRVGPANLPPLTRIVVAVDPAVSSGPNADETGIVIAGKGEDGRCYVLADRSIGGVTPEQWARRAVDAYQEFDADLIIGERNQGGSMTETIIRSIAPNINYRSVFASRGKAARAEPVSSLYERGLVSHVGELGKLEDQLASLTLDFDPRRAGFSPDRADAAVYAVSALMLPDQQPSKMVVGRISGF